jgi:ribosomal protein S18 acetylase RimI-like enzyme
VDSETLEPPAISVRRMRDGEEQAVKTLAGRAFPPLGSAFFPSSPNALVAERDGKLVGAVVPRTFWLPGGRKCGVMFWLMTDPDVRGVGVGGQLVGDALRHFEGQGCTEVFAGVEGYNTSSANLLAGHGFLWARPGQARTNNPLLQWWVGVLVSSLMFLLAGWRGGWIGGSDLATVLGAVAIVVALYGLREGAMRLAAHLQGLPMRYRAWESAFPLSLGTALALGIFLPVPGSVYPRQRAWRYRTLLPKLGPVACAGASAVLIFAWAAWSVGRFSGLPPEVAAWLRAAHVAGLTLVAVDVLLAFFPFASFNGRRIWDWKRAAWGVLAVTAVGLFLAAR